METTEAADEASEEPGPSGIGWAIDVAGLGISVVGVLYVVLSVAAGLAIKARQFPGDELHRVGYVAASAIDLRIGLAAVVAAALVAASVHVHGSAEGTSTRAAGVLTLTFAALSAVLALLAVRAQYHQLDLRHTTATAAFNLSQATYVAGSVGPAVIGAVIAGRAVLGPGGRR